MPAAPKPAAPAPRERWFQPRRSGFRWEQEGLDHLRNLMPKTEPYRAWATFQFTGPSGRINECDLLIAVPGGLYLLELKGHPGRVVNHGDTWQFHSDGRVRTLRNPLYLTDLKAKELKGQLERAARTLGMDPRQIPFIKPAVFLHDPGLVSELDDFQRTAVYGRNEGTSGLPRIWDDLLGRPPERESRRITPIVSQRLEQLMQKIGISHSTAHLRFGDDWKLYPRALDAGPGWEDRLAERDDGLVQESGRVRIYLVGQAASDEQRAKVERAARREYQVLQGINHRGIVQAVQIREHQGGPAILFRHRESDLRLDAYLDAYGGQLTPLLRLDLVRQLAEAVRYAHNRSLYHRALAARSVYVSAREDGSEPVLRIADWQTAARDFETTMHRSLGDTPLDTGLIADAAQVYLAPETDQEFADPVDLDVFGLGALTYLLLTGRPPADRRSSLLERLQSDGGLHPYAVTDSVSAALDTLVFRATAADVRDRLASVDEFLDLLAAAEADAAAPQSSAGPSADPLTVQPGGQLDAEWTVVRVLGTGATARALLVRRTAVDGEEEAPRVFKVALDREKDARLYAEAKALKEVGGGRIVKLLAEPRELAGHTVLEIEYAGGYRGEDDREPVSLGSRLRDHGPLGYDQLERFGNDLFDALDALAARGVRHRDIKPDNLGLFKRSDGSWQLMLFDFSLADVPDQDVHAGTRGYLDPFLGSAGRSRYDDHAEWYAAAVTLHEMASGERPVWGDGQSDPRMVTDAELHVATELFPQALSEGLKSFFERALHRDVEQRFDTLRQMQEAWRQVFRTADAARPATTPATVGISTDDLEDAREQAAAAASLETPLAAAGLSPRAVAVAESLKAHTVEQLLNIPPHHISRARGAGNAIRKELNRRHRQWTQALRRRPAPKKPVALEPDAPQEALESVDTLAARLVPPAGKRRTRPRSDVVRATLQLPGVLEDGEALEPWPSQSLIAKALGISQPTVSQNQQIAVEAWARLPWLGRVRDEVVSILAERNRVSTAEELAAELRARHGAGDGTPAESLAKALAVVRAAVEAEIRKRDDDQPGAGSGEPVEAPARLAVQRRNGRVVIALEDQPGADEPTPAELADYAAALGEAAVGLARRDPLPGRATVLRELRAVPAPEGMAPLADTRLVELAASMAGEVAFSPRLELFPLDLSLSRALRISQAPAGVRPETGITPDDLLSRVRARFPGLAVLDETTYVELSEALAEAGFPLDWNPDRRRFCPRVEEGTGSRLGLSSSTRTSTSSLYAAAQGRIAEGQDPREVLSARLTEARRRGGFLALTLKGSELPGVADALAARYETTAVSLNALFLDCLRELAEEQSVRWQALLKADAKYTATGTLGAALASYTRVAAERVRQRVVETAERTGPRAVLLAHEAGLIARYWEAGGRELLAALQQSARRPADIPHGLWLLLPTEDPHATPTLDGRTVEVVDRATEWEVLDKLFLKSVRTADSPA
ncbi:BREX system serine/threonine kinase PglW [Streptomyces thermoalcalitolerans]|uniref:BREX system serine/threonine kinase PglW n=1 Tax=Streptomyces thermoalcalitolerans TaxID=65605 RepID=A0ABP3ZQU9_9ACTN